MADGCSGGRLVTDRRDFLKFALVAGSGLTIGLVLPETGDARSSGTGGEQLVMSFIRISPDNKVTVISKHLEMGQGVHTGLCAIAAEELDADWNQIEVENAPVKLPLYANLLMDPQGRMQVTGGSMSIASSWEQMRRAGATARAMLVQAAAEQWRVPSSEIMVSEGVVRHAESNRTAKFGNLASRAAKLPIPDKVALKDPAEFKLIGKRDLCRVDSRAKSTGREQYGADLKLPGTMTAVIARSPRFGGEVKSFSPSKAAAMPGVVDIVEIPRGVAIVAHTSWQAMQARAALEVEWDDSIAEMRGSDKMFEDYKRLGAVKEAAVVARAGDIDAAFPQCAKVISAEFEFPYLAHAMMEPLNAVVKLTPERCEIWTGSQFPSNDRLTAATVAGLKPEQVVIHALAAGGSFGRRGSADYIAEAVSIAKATKGKYPVRLIWTREDDIGTSRYRPMNYHRIRAGLDHHGALVAYEQRIVGQSLLMGTPLEGMIQNGVDPTAVSGHAPEQYRIPNAEITWTRATTGVPVQFWRSVQHTHMAFSAEVMMDELAELAGQDPVAFRKALLAGRPRQLEAIRLAVEKSGWGEPLASKGEGRRGRGIAVQETFGSVVVQVAEVTVGNDTLRVDRVVCVVDCGIAVTPNIVRAQMESGIIFGLSAALYSKVTLTDGVVDQSNFHDYPVLRMNEVPHIEVYIVPSANPPSGVGEPGTPPIAPAVANAIRAASGLKIRRLPFDLEVEKR